MLRDLDGLTQNFHKLVSSTFTLSHHRHHYDYGTTTRPTTTNITTVTINRS